MGALDDALSMALGDEGPEGGASYGGRRRRYRGLSQRLVADIATIESMLGKKAATQWMLTHARR